MEKVMKQQRDKFEMQKNQYQEQIKTLRKRIEQKRINLGHLFSYKEWESEKLVPETMIIEKGEENVSELTSHGIQDEQMKKKAEEIMNYYMNYHYSSDSQEESLKANPQEE